MSLCESVLSTRRDASNPGVAYDQTTMSTTETDLFDALTALDDLIQVIYQGVDRFVLLSRLHLPFSFSAPTISSEPSPHWDLYLGHADKARWWRAHWKEADVKGFVGPSASPALAEAFAENSAKAVINGELYVSGFSDLRSESNMKVRCA